MNQRDYQRNFCAGLIFLPSAPILNIACKEDPYHLARDFGAINCDLLDFDPHTKTDLTKLPNFVHGDARALPFNDGKFSAAVMGEFIEHCLPPVASICVFEAARVLIPGGKLCLTFPLDSRPAESQHAKEHLVTWADGITSWHQTVWTDDMLKSLFAFAKLTELSREPLGYGWADGWGITLTK